MQCALCEVDQDDNQFAEYSPICRDCVEHTVKLCKVEYSVPVENGRTSSCILLIQAIRDQAVEDDLLKDFEEYWIYSPPWDLIISIVRRSIYEKKNEVFV